MREFKSGKSVVSTDKLIVRAFFSVSNNPIVDFQLALKEFKVKQGTRSL